MFVFYIAEGFIWKIEIAQYAVKIRAFLVLPLS